MKANRHSGQYFNHGIQAWLIWTLACIFYFYECLLQVSPSVMSNELMHDFAVTGKTLGLLSGIYFYSYAVTQLPAGVLMDHFGPKRLISFATLLCAISTIGFASTEHFFMACISRLMMGFGSAFAVLGVLKLSATWFPAERFAFLTGLMVTVGMLGAIGGETPLAFLVEYFKWRTSMLIMGGSGVLLAILIYLFVHDAPKNYQTSLIPNNNENLSQNLLTIFKNKQLWLVALYGGLMYMATPVFCGLWGVPFLMLKMGISKAEAANFVSLIFVGWAIASPFWGIFSNRISLRKPPMYTGCIGALACSLALIYYPIQSKVLMQVFLLLFGIFSAGFLPAFSLAKELCSQKYVATGLSFMNMMNMIGIAIAQPLVGYALDYWWNGNYSQGVRVYSLEAYHAGLAILPLGMFMALLILPKIRETYCRNVNP